MTKKPKAPKGYKKRVTVGKPSAKKPTKAQRQALEIKKLKHELREERRKHKATKVTAKKLKHFKKTVEKFIDWKKEKVRSRAIKQHRKEIISRFQDQFDDYVDSDEDFDDWEDTRDDLVSEYELTLEDWLDIMTDEGFTEHEAYDLWYGY